MAPLDLSKEDEEDITKSNKRLFVLQATGQPCKFANNIFEEKQSVECSYDSSAPGVHPLNIEPAPFYSRVYNNVALDGLYSYPLGYYADYNISRNLYYGTYSIQSEEKHELVKVASDISDAIEHSIMIDSPYFSGNVFFDKEFEGKMSLEEILNWDDYSSWGEFSWEEFKGFSKEEIIKELNNFRSGYGDLVFTWKSIPPIVLVELLDGTRCIGDGRGRVNYAMATGMHFLPTIILKEKEDSGDIVFNFKNGLINKKETNV